jgi:hypothetical protein
MDEARTRTVSERIVEAMREIGVLLIAFAPLDAAFSGGPGALRLAVAFFAVGLVFFAGAVVLEGRRSHGH